MNPVFQKVLNGISKHSPEILTGIGLAGMISGTVLAVKATPKAIKQIEQRCEEEHVDELSFGEKFRTVWRCYIPAAVTTVLSSGCIVSGLSINLGRNAGLAAATSLAEAALHECQDKIIELVGEEKGREAIREVSEKKAERVLNDIPKSEQKVILTGTGNTLCLDSLTGVYFKSDVAKIDKAVNEFNRDLRDENFKLLNDFYTSIGLPSCGMGDIFGVFIDRGYLDITYTSQLTDDNEPVLVLVYGLYPLMTYDDYRNRY